MTKATFAIPGDMHRKTGGFIYEARLLQTLNTIGCKTQYLQLPDSFPQPTPADMQTTLDLLCAVPQNQPIILDGLVFGAIDPAGLAQVKAPVIAMIHHPLGLETGLPAAQAAFLVANEMAAIKHATHILVPSPHTAKTLIDKFGGNPDSITIALPGFDRPVLAPQPQDPPLILSVGLLAPRKGHDILLAALDRLTDLDWQCEIVGKSHDPIYAQTLTTQMQSSNIVNRVSFSGELTDAALQNAFDRASIFALATRYEGYGMVLSEAMLNGLPIASCDTGAVPETVGNAGLLVPVDDARAFSDALRLLLTDRTYSETLVADARKRALALPTWEDTARRVAAILTQRHG